MKQFLFRAVSPRACALAAVTVLSVLVGLAPEKLRAEAAGPPGSPEAEANRVAEELVRAKPAIGGLAKSRRLSELERYLPRSTYQRLLESAVEDSDDPIVEFHLRRELSRTLRERGQLEAYDQPLSGQGCLRSWRVAGPFDNNSMQAFDRRLPPERGEAGPYRGKVTEIDWRALPDFDRGCVYRLGRTVQPSTSAVVYLATTIHVESPADAQLLVGSAGAYKIWVDGELVANRRDELGLFADSDAWSVQLEKGRHRVLVKLASRSNASMGFVARVVDSDMRPLESLRATPEWSGSEVGDSAPESRESFPEASGRGVIARLRDCATGGDGSTAAWCASLWSQAASRRAATPWRDVAERLAEPIVASSESASTDLPPRALVRIANLFEDQADELRVVRLAREMAPDDPWIGLQMARVYRASLGRLNRRRARTVLEDLVRDHPEFWPASLALAGWYSSNGFEEKALGIVRAIKPEEPLERPLLLRRLTNLEASVGTRERARELRERWREVDATNGSWAWQEFRDRTARGEHQQALELVRGQLRLHPLSKRWGLKEVELLRALGKSDAALERLDAMIEQRPGDVRLRRRKAELLVAGDRTEDAVAALERAVEIEPQNEQLDQFLSELQTGRQEFHKPWMIDDARAYADRHPPGSHSDDTIIDQTVVQVSPNGLSKRVVQRLDRAITSEGVGAAANLSVSYTRGDERVEVIDVKVYKSDGRVLEDYDQWRSGRSKKSGPYYNDQRQLNIQANNVEKGDLVEFRYRVREIVNENFRGDYFGDISYVQATRPIGFWRYVVEAPDSWDLHFREPKLEHESVDPERPGDAEAPEDYQIRGFALEEVPAVETDSDQPGYADVYDYILVSNKETWNEVGEWWWNLIEEQLIVNDAIARTVEEVTEGLDSDRAKLEALHTYVVKNTRYLHVGLGIHGWKPYRTTQCFRNKYGDCKDKSSLLKVMLEEAGIRTNLVLVRTRRLGTVADRPASMHIFNHAINYIPSMDLYLDPTAEFNGTEQLPPMDQGAQALIVRDGGETDFTRLPVDEPDDNLLIRELDVDLSKDPSVTSGQVVARGQNAVYYRRSLENPERRDEKFEKQLSDLFPGAELVSATYENLDELEEPVEIQFEFKGGRLERSSDRRSYVFPYGAPKDLLSRYAEQAERDQDLKIRVPFANETTMRFRTSADRGFERVPESVELDSEFGSLEIQYARDDGALVAEIRYSIGVQRVPVEKYSEFRSFLSRATSELNDVIGLTDETTNQ